MIPKIVNIVCNCDLKTVLNLKYITENSNNAIYNPSKFTAIIMKFRSPQSTVQIFPNGKLLITGTNNENNSRIVGRKVVRLLKKLGYTCKVNNFSISNIVATIDLKELIKKQTGTVIDLQRLAKEDKQNVKYNPERFSAVTKNINGIKAMIFHNGKVNFTGAKNVISIFETFDMLITFLLENKYIEI